MQKNTDSHIIYTKTNYWRKKKIATCEKGGKRGGGGLECQPFKKFAKKMALEKLAHFDPIHYNSKFAIMIKAQKNIDEGQTVKINIHLKSFM